MNMQTETAHKETEILELKSTIAEIKNSLQQFNNCFEMAGERIGEPEKQKLSNLSNRERRLKKDEQSFRDMCNNIKHTNTYTMEIPEGEERRRLPNLIKILIHTFKKLNKLNVGKIQRDQHIVT